MTTYLERTLHRINQASPSYARKLDHDLSAMNPVFFQRAEELLGRFAGFLEGKGKGFEYGIDCHLKLRDSMLDERLEFLRSGHYRSKSFAEVKARVYENPGVMETHMYGLVFSQLLWREQYARYCFFAEHLPRYCNTTDTYLEVGGGHAWYVKTAVDLLAPGTRFTLVDVSPTSIELAKGLSPNDRISYCLSDILELPSDKRYSMISVGEVIEHLEDPLGFLIRVRQMLAENGRAFISTPTNSATTDHIYLFNNTGEITAMLDKAGFEIEFERTCHAEDIPPTKAAKLRVAEMFAAFVRPKAGM